MSEKRTVNSGITQGSILGPLLFTEYINNLSENAINAKMHLYADDTIIYCSEKSPAETILRLQKAFENIQLNLQAFNLVLNDKKTKYMFFNRTCKSGPSLPQLHTLQGRLKELVCSYKYLGFILDEIMCFILHIKQLLTKLKLKLGFYLRNRSCFTQKARKNWLKLRFCRFKLWRCVLQTLHKDLVEIIGFCVSFSIEIYNPCKSTVLCTI